MVLFCSFFWSILLFIEKRTCFLREKTSSWLLKIAKPLGIYFVHKITRKNNMNGWEKAQEMIVSSLEHI